MANKEVTGLKPRDAGWEPRSSWSPPVLQCDQEEED